MNTPETPSKAFSNGLWIPALIILVGFSFSVTFAVKALKGYKQPRPLLIKPSSVETPKEISDALYKALYPLKKRGYGATILHLDNHEVSFKVAHSLAQTFPPAKFAFKFNAYKVDLAEPHNTEKTDCKNTALFNLKRKPKRNWKKKIYFAVCTEDKERFSLFYTTR